MDGELLRLSTRRRNAMFTISQFCMLYPSARVCSASSLHLGGTLDLGRGPVVPCGRTPGRDRPLSRIPRLPASGVRWTAGGQSDRLVGSWPGPLVPRVTIF